MYYLCVCVCALARVREREKLGKGVAIVAMQGSMINMSDQKCFASKDDVFFHRETMEKIIMDRIIGF